VTKGVRAPPLSGPGLDPQLSADMQIQSLAREGHLRERNPTAQEYGARTDRWTCRAGTDGWPKPEARSTQPCWLPFQAITEGQAQAEPAFRPATLDPDLRTAKTAEGCRQAARNRIARSLSAGRTLIGPHVRLEGVYCR